MWAICIRTKVGVMPRENEEDVYSTSQLAALAGVTKSAVALACKEGRIDGAYQFWGRWVIPKEGGDKYIALIKKNDLAT